MVVFGEAFWSFGPLGFVHLLRHSICGHTFCSFLDYMVNVLWSLFLFFVFASLVSQNFLALCDDDIRLKS